MNGLNTLALVLGGLIGLTAALKMLAPAQISNPTLRFIHKRIVVGAHSWITIVHELGHWFWGLPSGILSLHFIPSIKFDDSHNASTSMPMVRGPLSWVLSPIMSFGGYLSPVLLGGVFLTWGTQNVYNPTLAQIVLTILAIIMLVGARSLKTLLFTLIPLLLAFTHWALALSPAHSATQAGIANALVLFLGAILLVGGVGDILAVNMWAVMRSRMRLFFSTDFGLVAGWAYDDQGGDPNAPDWHPKPRMQFFFPHVALVVFDALVVFLTIGFVNQVMA